MKPVIVLELSEANVVKLMLEFLQEKELFVSQLSLEKETGVSNFAHCCDDAVFLRELIYAGNWDDVIDFLQPLFDIQDFPRDICTFLVLKGKYLEMLCLKAEITSLKAKPDDDFSDIVSCLKLVESVCPTKEEFRDLCYLLSLGSLNESPHYAKCTPHSIRAKCFRDLLQIVEPYFPYGRSMEPRSKTPATNRLKNLLIKGILYETCVELCTHRALANDAQTSDRVVADVSNRCLLNGPELSDADAGLVSWLESLPNEVYLLPFEQRSLELRFHALDSQAAPVKPSWAEYVVSQNQVEKSRLLAVAASTRLHLQSSTDSQSNVERPPNSPSKIARDNVRATTTITPQTSVNQSLVSAYTLAKLSNGPQPPTPNKAPPPPTLPKPSYSSNGEGIGSSGTVQLVTTSAPTTNQVLVAKPELGVSTGLSVPANTSLMGAKMGRNSPTVTSLPSNEGSRTSRSTAQDVQSSTKFSTNMDSINPASSNRYGSATPVSFTGDLSGSRSSSNQGHVGPSIPTAVPARMASQSRTRSTSPPARTPRQDSLSAPQGEAVKSLLQFTPVTVLEDTQPVRAVAIHQPSGKFYAVGSNSRNLRICYYPDVSRQSGEIDYPSNRDAFNNVPVPAKLVLQIQKYHRGSIFCLAWNNRGDLLASGSNDKSVKLINFDAHHQTVGSECEFTHHDATVRDLCFLGENDVLVSAGQGDCRVYLTDCGSQRVVRALSGHTDHIFSVCPLPGNSSSLVTGSRDRTIRLWDVTAAGNAPIFVIETPSPVNTIHSSAILSNDSRQSPNGGSYLLACGLASGACQLRDLRVPSRILAEWQPHNEEIRSVHLHPSLPFILSGSYDSTVALTTLSSTGGVIDLQHISNTHKVGVHLDKVVKCCWHPTSTAPLSFLSASADKTVVCWVQQQYQPLQKSTTSHIPTSAASASRRTANQAVN